MELTFSLETIATIVAVITPFFLSGLTKFISGMMLRIISREQIEKLVDAEVEFRNSLSRLSKRQYYSIMIGLPIVEELIFRFLPFVGIYFFNISSLPVILLIGVASSIMFGLAHWWNSKSVSFSLFIQGVMGIALFLLFFLFSEAFNIWTALTIVVTIHLMQNLIIGFCLKQPLDLDGQDWKVRHYYMIHSGRDFEKEFDTECEEMFREQEAFEKLIGYEKEIITSA